MEIWKDIIDFEGFYQISSFGNVKSLSRVIFTNSYTSRVIKERILKPALSNRYKTVVLNKDKFRKTVTIHRLVAVHFIDNLDNKPEVNHINGIKTDNRICNLEWNTSSENTTHAFKNGLSIAKKHEYHNRAKLTIEKVLEIRKLKGTMTQLNISRMYNISDSQVSVIMRNKNWIF